MLEDIAPVEERQRFPKISCQRYFQDDHLDPTKESHFLRLNFDMVTGFVIELMHTFEEGAFGNGLEGFASISNEKQISKEALTEVKSKSCGFQVLERQLLASNIPSAIFHVDLSVNKPFISQTMLVYTNAGLKH